MSKIFDNRAVAFIDVLGFKELIATKELQELAIIYERFLNDADFYNRFTNFAGQYFPKNTNISKPIISYTFSDSIILIANDDTEMSFISLVTYVWRLLQHSIFTKIPVRGGISYGEVCIFSNRNIVIGDGLTNAYLLESKQKWIGVSVDKSAYAQYEEIFSDEVWGQFFNELLIDYDVPLKSEHPNKLKAINWRVNLVLKAGTKAYLPLQHSDPAVKEKALNTLKFAEFVKKRGKVYFTAEDLPKFFETMAVGDTPPPFEHGDEY